MSYDFYVLEGKKLIDYKPKREHYERAFIRFCKKIKKTLMWFLMNRIN